MYPITDEVKALFESENRKVLNILGTDVNGNYFRITDADVIQDSFQIDRYCCNGERLEIGTTIAAQLSMKLENSDGRFNNTIFEGAELRVEVGVADWTQASPTVYWIPCGYFICDYQPRKLNIITITALDRMIRFDAVVDRSRITLPTVPVTLIGEICGICGVGYIRQANLPNADAPIDELPDDAISYRNLIAWCAGLMGTNAFVDWTGTLYFSFYSNTSNYVSTIDNRYNSDLYENDLSITGVTYTTDDGIEYVEGTGDYAFDLTGNVFISPIITTALLNLNNAVNGFTYRPFTASVINAPYLWPMDIITFRDKDGNDHQTALTNVCFGLNGTTALESRGMTYIINRQKIIGSFTKEQMQFINRMNSNLRIEMVTGVKGNEESLYRQGNVNLTPANIGAVDKDGDTMDGDLTINGDLTADNITLTNPLEVQYGGIGANNKPDAISNLFDVGINQPSDYPDKPGIYRVIRNIFSNLVPASYYGTLVIFQSVYGLHTFLDSYGNLYYGYSGDTFGEPTTWRMGVTDSDVIDVAHGGTGVTGVETSRIVLNSSLSGLGISASLFGDNNWLRRWGKLYVLTYSVDISSFTFQPASQWVVLVQDEEGWLDNQVLNLPWEVDIDKNVAGGKLIYGTRLSLGQGWSYPASKIRVNITWLDPN